jgi:hypothetical protein
VVRESAARRAPPDPDRVRAMKKLLILAILVTLGLFAAKKLRAA